MQNPTRPRDPNQLGKLIVDLSVGEADDSTNMPDGSGKDPAAVALGKKGGTARAASLSKKRKAEIATTSAHARWSKWRQKTAAIKLLKEQLLASESERKEILDVIQNAYAKLPQINAEIKATNLLISKYT